VTDTSTTPAPAKPKSGRGGARAGAGRKPKGASSPTSISGVDLKAALNAEVPTEIDAIAQSDVHQNITALVKLLTDGTSEPARITAAKEILDRGYGKPAVEIGGDAAPLLPFQMAPTPAFSLTSAVRAEARKYAQLAITVLRKIRDNGLSETARAAAAKALNDRSLGTVAAARMAEQMTDRPLGKKEEAAQAAQIAGTGRYATPSAPRRLADLN
jgi:hypothetical protein